MGLGRHCAYCGKLVRGNDKKTRDHVVPDQLFRGTGKTTAQRPTVRACLKCNNGSRRRDKAPTSRLDIMSARAEAGIPTT
jgi:hypothetical protein